MHSASPGFAAAPAARASSALADRAEGAGDSGSPQDPNSFFHPSTQQDISSSSDRDLAVHAYETWGFTGLSQEVIDTLTVWAHFVYGPLLEDRERPIQDQPASGIYGREVAEKVHRSLRELGGVEPPREFVFMDRAAIGLGGVFMHLKAEINWHRLFHELIDEFDSAAMHQRQTEALQRNGIPLP